MGLIGHAIAINFINIITHVHVLYMYTYMHING